VKRILRKQWNRSSVHWSRSEDGSLELTVCLDVWTNPGANSMDVIEAAPRIGDPVDLGFEDGGPPLYLASVRTEMADRGRYAVRCVYTTPGVGNDLNAQHMTARPTECEFCGREAGEGETCSGCGAPRKIPKIATPDLSRAFSAISTATSVGTIAGNFAAFFEETQ